GMRHRPTGIWLEAERLNDPAFAEIADEHVVIGLCRVGKGVEQAMHTLEYGARPVISGARQQRRADTRLRRPARMQALGPGAFGEIFDDAASHAADNAECIHE